MEIKCLICGNLVESMSYDSLYEKDIWICKLCGPYILGDFVPGTLNKNHGLGKYNLTKLKSALLYYLRAIKKNHLNKYNAAVAISDSEHKAGYNIDLDTAYNLYPDSFNEKLDMVIELLATKIDDIGKWFDIPSDSMPKMINNMKYDIFFMPSNEEMNMSYQRVEFCKLLEELKYITIVGENKISFTSKGWVKVDALKRKNNSKTAFIAMSFTFDNPAIAAAERCIKQAISEAGYVPQIISDKEHNNFIMDEIIYEIKQAAFIVADLTQQKTGVYYEAGYARALGKEVIFTCHSSDFENRHFDIAQVNTIEWENEEKFIVDLKRRIQVTVGLNKIY